MKAKCTIFLSDLHLGAPYLADSREVERRVVGFLDSIKEEADSIYLLGDILDYWYEYKYVVPRGFVRFFGKLAELSDSGIKIVWLIGNHDIWIFDYLPNELGIDVIDGNLDIELHGKRCFLSHGDGIGKLPGTFRIIRSIFRSRFCQFLFASMHPRWTVPFAYRWSRHSRKVGDNVTEDKKIKEELMLSNLKTFATSYLKQNPGVDYFIFGHIHILVKEAISKDSELIVLGEWIRTFSYAKLDSAGLTLQKWVEKRVEK